jgi:hypothetical protein
VVSKQALDGDIECFFVCTFVALVWRFIEPNLPQKSAKCEEPFVLGSLCVNAKDGKAATKPAIAEWRPTFTTSASQPT